MVKPLTAAETKALIEAFRRNPQHLNLYAARDLTESQRKALLTAEDSWIVVGKSRWE